MWCGRSMVGTAPFSRSQVVTLFVRSQEASRSSGAPSLPTMRRRTHSSASRYIRAFSHSHRRATVQTTERGGHCSHGPYGENLATSVGFSDSIAKGINGWAGEACGFPASGAVMGRAQLMPPSTALYDWNNPTFGSGTGHFTQVYPLRPAHCAIARGRLTTSLRSWSGRAQRRSAVRTSSAPAAPCSTAL